MAFHITYRISVAIFFSCARRPSKDFFTNIKKHNVQCCPYRKNSPVTNDLKKEGGARRNIPKNISGKKMPNWKILQGIEFISINMKDVWEI